MTISNYGGDPTPAHWTVYSIPLADLGASNTNVTSIVIHEWAGRVQNTIFVDNIQFVAGSGLSDGLDIQWTTTTGTATHPASAVVDLAADPRRLTAL